MYGKRYINITTYQQVEKQYINTIHKITKTIPTMKKSYNNKVSYKQS